ncbi:hypothetical protein WM25_09710 [Burkholderia ubonensis]|nr:hypothetical protein WM25_09710 [Burkholderia ubonensis]
MFLVIGKAFQPLCRIIELAWLRDNGEVKQRARSWFIRQAAGLLCSQLQIDGHQGAPDDSSCIESDFCQHAAY